MAASASESITAPIGPFTNNIINNNLGSGISKSNPEGDEDQDDEPEWLFPNPTPRAALERQESHSVIIRARKDEAAKRERRRVRALSTGVMDERRRRDRDRDVDAEDKKDAGEKIRKDGLMKDLNRTRNGLTMSPQKIPSSDLPDATVSLQPDAAMDKKSKSSIARPPIGHRTRTEAEELAAAVRAAKKLKTSKTKTSTSTSLEPVGPSSPDLDSSSEEDPLLISQIIPTLGPTIRESLETSGYGTRLIKFVDLPIWMRNNEYLERGYR